MKKENIKKMARQQRIMEDVLWASREAFTQNIPFCKIPQCPHARQRLLKRGIIVKSSHEIRMGHFGMFGSYDELPRYL